MAVTYGAPTQDTAPASGAPLYFSFPISKMEKDERGNLVIKGVATDGTVDSDHQIVDADWSAKALTDWLATGGNVRMSHDSKRPIGKGVQVELDRDGDGKHWVKSVIVDPLAVKLVEEGVLRAYSVGIIDPVIKRDPTGRAPGGIICGGALAELSVVDRPANKNAYLELAKAAADGSARFTGTMYADPQLVTAVEESIAAANDLIQVALPKGAQVSFSPSDLAALLKSQGTTAEKRKFDPNVGGGTDRDKIPAADFAGRDRSFPIVTPGDVSDAASSIGRAGADNYSSEQLKSNIISIARRKGPSFVAQLPDAWTDGDNKEKAMDPEIMDTDEALEKAKKKPFPGAAPPMDGKDSDGDGADTDKPGSHEDDDENPPKKVKPGSTKAADADDEDKPSSFGNEDADKPDMSEINDASGGNTASKAEGELITKGNRDCPSCGKEFHADSKLKRCSECGAKLPKLGKSARVTAGRTQPTPAEGVTGEHAEPVAQHREPDGPAIEQFEADMKIPTDPDSNYMKSMWRLKQLNVPADMGALHDLLCPAYEPVLAQKSHPFTRLETLDTSLWQQKALDAAANAPLSEAKWAAKRWQHAVTLSETHPELLTELRFEAHKAFADANMGPTSAPKPTEITAQRFKRPNITAGHARPSFQYEGPNTAPVPSGQISAESFQRGPITEGHATPSPANKTTASELIDTGAGTGVPHRVFYSNAQKENARAAMAALHDHIAQSFPDVCTMCSADAPGDMGGTPSSKPMPEAVKTVEVQVQGTVMDVAQLSQDVALLVAKGLISADTARAALAPEPVVKAKKKKPKPKMDDAMDADMMKALLAEALAPLHAELEAANKALKAQKAINQELRKTVDAIASQPDPAGAPWRGQAVLQQTYKSMGVEKSAPMDAAEIAGRANAAVQRELEYQFNTSTDPVAREAAWGALAKMRGMR